MAAVHGRLKRKETCRVICQEQIGAGIYSLWLQAGAIAREARPGQFVMVYCKDGSRLLPRPISICQAEGISLRLVYRVVGAGTREFSELGAGQAVDVLGPLGNGFPVDAAVGKKLLLVGGGIGIPPMLGTAECVGSHAAAVLGYRDEVFLKESFEEICPVAAAVENGALGSGCVRGNVLDAIREKGLRADLIFACGPVPMLRAVKDYAQGEGIPCWVSLEERMACGVGACLGCVCDSVQEDAYSHVNRKRVCKDGPVFLSTDVVWD